MRIKLLIVLMFALTGHAQDYHGRYITNQNDTIDVMIKKPDNIFPLVRTFEMQESITVVEKGTVKRLTPKDIASFSYRTKEEMFTFDSLDGVVFGQRLHKGKAKVYKVLQKIPSGMHEAFLRVYLFQKPGEEIMHRVAANGFSRLLKKSDLIPLFADCKPSQEKLEKDVIKIKDEERLIAFMRDYESTCYN